MTSSLVRRSRSATAAVVVALVLGLAILAVGGWFVWQAISNRAGSQLLQRLPDVDVTRLSERSRRLMVSCQESVRLDPADASAWGLLGRAYLAHQFQQEAGQCFQVAAELEPENFEWHYAQALTLIPNNNSQAIELIRQAIELTDENVDQLQCRLAELLFDEAEFTECRGELEKVLEKTPNHPRANMLLARLFLIENQPQESLRCIQLVTAVQPERQEALRLLSQIHSRLGNSREAAKFAAEAEDPQAYNPSWPDKINEKIQSLRKDISQLVPDAMRLPPSKVMERLRILEEAVEEEPHEPQWHVFLGQTLLKVRDFDKANEVMKKAVELHPESAIVQYTFGLVLLNEGKAKEAIPVLEKAVELKSDYSGAFLDLGIAYRLENSLDKAIEAFEKSLKILPGNFKTQLNLAVTLELDGQVDRAIAAYRQCLELDDQSADVCLLLGKLYVQKKDVENARKYLNQAVALDPNLAEAKALLNSLNR